MFDTVCNNTWVSAATRAARIAACIAGKGAEDTYDAADLAVTYGTAELAHYVNYWWFLDNANDGWGDYIWYPDGGGQLVLTDGTVYRTGRMDY